VGFHLFARFSRAEADWFETRLGFCGKRLGTPRRRKAQKHRWARNGNRNRNTPTGARRRKSRPL
jgi:hypothetical protein